MEILLVVNSGIQNIINFEIENSKSKIQKSNSQIKNIKCVFSSSTLFIFLTSIKKNPGFCQDSWIHPIFLSSLIANSTWNTLLSYQLPGSPTGAS